MKKSIWKFALNFENPAIQMPKGAEILTLQMQGDQPCIWALVDPEAEKETRCFDTIGTGHKLEYGEGINVKYIGTYQMLDGKFVGHLFEFTNNL